MGGVPRNNDNEGDPMTKILQEVLAANERYAASFDKGALKRTPAHEPINESDIPF